MILTQSIPRIVHKVLPAKLRIYLRGNVLVRRLASVIFQGIAHCPLPDSQFEIYYDGYRNIGVGADVRHIERDERQAIRRILHQRLPRVVWDVGANIGLWTLFLSSSCPTDTEIRCFEPDPINVKFLNLNMTRNRISNWIICPVALSNNDGISTFYSDPVCGATGSLNRDHDFIGRNFGAKRGKFDVQTTTVDEEIARGARPPDFMKIDVEGHELAVLEGAFEAIKVNRPLLIFETSRDHEKIAAFLSELNYGIFDPSGRIIDLPVFNTIAIPREAKIVF